MEDIKHLSRGTGRTSDQLKAAPKGAVYVWVNNRLNYPKRLALDLGREDLEIVAPSWLEYNRFMGRIMSGLILDHAVNLTDRQREVYEVIKHTIRGPVNAR